MSAIGKVYLKMIEENQEVFQEMEKLRLDQFVSSFSKVSDLYGDLSSFTKKQALSPIFASAAAVISFVAAGVFAEARFPITHLVMKGIYSGGSQNFKEAASYIFQGNITQKNGNVKQEETLESEFLKQVQKTQQIMQEQLQNIKTLLESDKALIACM